MNLTSLSTASVAAQRDQYGRLRAPVFINGKGPFHLIVDTGANASAVTTAVAEALGFSPGQSPEVVLHGVTGSAKIAAIRVNSLSFGYLTTPAATLGIVDGALDGADGYLGTGVLTDKRLVIDFRRDQITISTSEPAEQTHRGIFTVPADLSHSRLVAVNTRVNGVRVKAIIDTGAASTIGNAAMRKLLNGAEADDGHRDQIIGTVENGGAGRTYLMPPIELGDLRILGARASFGDMPIFNYLQLSEEPSLLLGMDILGRFASVIIDYGAQRMQFVL